MQYDGNLKLLGTFLKTHGVNGHLVIKLSFFKEDELEEGEPVFVNIEGIPVPFFVSSFRFLSDDSALLKLDETNSSTEASIFVNCNAFIENSKDGVNNGNTSAEFDDLKGYRIVDQKLGEAGILQEILEFPKNPVMRIDLNGREILIPFNENIITRINHHSGIIEISSPEGLFNLYM